MKKGYEWHSFSLSLSCSVFSSLSHTTPPPPQHPDEKRLEGLSKQLDWNVRTIQRWFRQRRNQEKPSTLARFCESMWESFSFFFIHSPHRTRCRYPTPQQTMDKPYLSKLQSHDQIQMWYVVTDVEGKYLVKSLCQSCLVSLINTRAGVSLGHENRLCWSTA